MDINLIIEPQGSESPGSKKSSISLSVEESLDKKQSKWTPEEDNLMIELRGQGMKWDGIAKQLSRRSPISCRLRYHQNYLEKRVIWNEEMKNKLARLYARSKDQMWQKIATEIGIPWPSAESMHWRLGEREMSARANAPVFQPTNAAQLPPSTPPQQYQPPPAPSGPTHSYHQSRRTNERARSNAPSHLGPVLPQLQPAAEIDHISGAKRSPLEIKEEDESRGYAKRRRADESAVRLSATIPPLELPLLGPIHSCNQLPPRLAQIQPKFEADPVNGAWTTLAPNFNETYFKDCAVALLRIAMAVRYEGQYRVPFCIYGLYKENMGVGLIMDLNYCLPDTVTIQCAHQDKLRKVVMLECSVEHYSALVDAQSTPTSIFEERIDSQRRKTFTSTFRRIQADYPKAAYEQHLVQYITKELTDGDIDEGTDVLQSSYAESVDRTLLNVTTMCGMYNLEYAYAMIGSEERRSDTGSSEVDVT